MGSYRFFDHMADVGISIEADSLADLFETAGLGLMAWIGAEPSTTSTLTYEIELGSDDLESLLVRWLQELLYHFQHRHVYFVGVERLDVNINHPSLAASVVGKIWKEAHHSDYQEVKAVTYHKLKIEHNTESWRASVILDI
jgi:protein archease